MTDTPDPTAGSPHHSPANDGPMITGYRDLSPLGQGGFAVVYKAYQERFDRVVAVKVLTIDLDERSRERFIRECQAAGKLSTHPNVVTVLDAGVAADGRPFMTTELMERGSIWDWIERNGPMPLVDALQVGVKMCGALSVVHAAGILHRDVKPHNILVSGYGEPALADFGISAVGMGTAGARATMAFTPEYTPPEILEGRPPEPSMDVYSLGATIYALLTGLPPFVSGEDEALLPFIRRLMNDPVPPLPPTLAPPEVVAVLAVAMAKDPTERFQTAEAFGEQLQQLQASLGHPITPMLTKSDPGASDPTAGIELLLRSSTTNVISPTIAGPPAKSNGPWIAAAAVVVVLGLVVAALVFGRSNSPPDGSGSLASGQPVASSTGGTTTDGAAAPNAATPTSGGTLRVALRDPIIGLHPTTSGINPSNMAILTAVTDPLVRLTNGEVEAVLAESLEPNADLTVWTLKIRQGVTFHDGTPLDAQAVAESLNDIAQNVMVKPLIGPVQTISPTDTKTVVFTLSSPWSALPAALTTGWGSVLKRGTKSDGPNAPEVLVGTGPFRMTSGLAQPKSGVRLERHDGYWGAKPLLDGLEFRLIPSEEERISALEKGEIDALFTSEPATMNRLRARFPTITQLGAIVDYVVINTAVEPFDDVRLRQAMALAIDRTALVTASGSPMLPASTADILGPFAPPGSTPPTPDIAKARSLVAAWVTDQRGKGPSQGKKPAIKMASILNHSSSKLSDPLKRMWEGVGFAVDVTAVEPQQMTADLLAGNRVPNANGNGRLRDDATSAALNFLAIPQDPDLFYPFVHTDSGPNAKAFSLNLARIADPAVDAALEAGRDSSDSNARRTAYATLTSRLDEVNGYLFLTREPYAMVTDTEVLGLGPDLEADLVRGGAIPWPTRLGVAQ